MNKNNLILGGLALAGAGAIYLSNNKKALTKTKKAVGLSDKAKRKRNLSSGLNDYRYKGYSINQLISVIEKKSSNDPYGDVNLDDEIFALNQKLKAQGKSFKWTGSFPNEKIEIFEKKSNSYKNELFPGLSGVYDPGILKCVFMAGGTGSGKSFVAKNLFGISKNSFVASGLKIVNSDEAFEKGLKEANIDSKKLSEIEATNPELWEKIAGENDSIRVKAKNITSKKQKSYESGKLGLLVDGTGDNFEKMKIKRQLAMNNGYDAYMVFVNTSLDVAIYRNRTRERRLSDALVKKKWQSAQENKAKYKKLFGANFIEVENSKPGLPEQKIQKSIDRFLKEPVKNPIGKKWINTQLKIKSRY